MPAAVVGEGRAEITVKVRTELDRISEITGRRFQTALRMGLRTHLAHTSPPISSELHRILGTADGASPAARRDRPPATRWPSG